MTSFGTSYKDAKEKSLEIIENETRKKYGTERVEKAYTSGIIKK